MEKRLDQRKEKLVMVDDPNKEEFEPEEEIVIPGVEEDEPTEEPEETPEEEPEEEPEEGEPDPFVNLELEGISDEERDNPLYKKFQAHFTRVRQRDAQERKEYEALKRIIQEDPEVKKALQKRLGLAEPEEPKEPQPPDPEEFLNDPQGYIEKLVEAKLKQTVQPIQSTIERQAQEAQLAKWAAEIKALEAKYEDFATYEPKMQAYLQKKPLVAQAVMDGEMSLEEVYKLVAGPRVTRKAKARREKAQRNASPSKSPSQKSDVDSLDEIIRLAIEENS